MREVALLSLLAAPRAFAADVDTWVGGHATTGAQIVQDAGASTILSQVELDARASTGSLFFRLDLDFHVDPWSFRPDGNTGFILAPHYPLPPEYALVQVGQKFHLRAGVTNPDFGIQEWDERLNYLATTSEGWKVANGQNLGIEPGISFDNGVNIFAFGGYDLAWLTPGGGAGIQTEQDAFGTWSGFVILPAMRYGLLLTANEVYPTDWLWFSGEIDAGFIDGTAFGGGQLIAQVFPEGAVGGALRLDRQWMPEAAGEALGDVNAFAVSGGLKAAPVSGLHLALEAKESWPKLGDSPYFTGTVLVDFQLSEEPSDDFAVRDPAE